MKFKKTKAFIRVFHLLIPSIALVFCTPEALDDKDVNSVVNIQTTIDDEGAGD